MRLPCVDQPRHEPGASVVATPAPGRGVGHHAVRGWPPEPEQSRPTRFVGAEDSALAFRMRAGFIGQQEACPRHHPCGPGGQRRTGIVGARDATFEERGPATGHFERAAQKRERASVTRDVSAR